MKYLVYYYDDNGGYYESAPDAIHSMCVVEADTEEEARRLGAVCMGWVEDAWDNSGFRTIPFDKLVHGFEII